MRWSGFDDNGDGDSDDDDKGDDDGFLSNVLRLPIFEDFEHVPWYFCSNLMVSMIVMMMMMMMMVMMSDNEGGNEWRCCLYFKV